MGKDQELLEAARKGNLAVVEKILGQRAKRSGPLASLRRGPGANVQDSSGYSALHHAALNGHREIVKQLLEHDASPNIVDFKGSSPLHLAAWSGNVDIVRLLLSGPSICNVNLTSKDDDTALHCAAHFGHTGVVSLLLEHACDPGIRNCRGETALDLAAQYGRLDTVELLVRTDPSLIQCLRHAAPDIVYPHTPLHLASRNGHKSVVEVLLRAGFNVNMRTKAGTALHEAALCGKVEVVRCLLEHGVNPQLRDINNYTVMDLLSQFNTAQAKEIVAILKRHRKGLTIVDSDGESISHPFPALPHGSTDSDMGSPYENVRPSSKNNMTSSSPGNSPQRWDFQRHARPPELFDDRRVSGVSGISIMNSHLRPSTVGSTQTHLKRNAKPYQSLPMSISKKRARSKNLTSRSSSSNQAAPLDGITFSFSEQLSLKKTASTSCLDRDIDTDPPNSDSSRESVNSLYHQTQCYGVPKAFMDSSVHSEDLNYLCTSGRESDQISLSSTASSSGYPRRPDSGGVPLYIPMNKGSGHSPGSNNSKVSVVKQQNPRRKLRRNPDVYEEYDFTFSGASPGGALGAEGSSTARKKKDKSSSSKSGKREEVASCSAPETTFVSSAFIMVSDNGGTNNFCKRNYKRDSGFPMSPTHYKQPPTPDHPPPSAVQAESVIYEKMRPLSQEYKRLSRDMETETEDEYLLIYTGNVEGHESSGSLSSSVSLSGSSVDNIIAEECHSDAPFAENISSNVERPKTLKKLKRVYDGGGASKDASSTSIVSDNEKSSSSEKESSGDNKENKERISSLSPFDEQEEWAKIQEIMASFGSGIVRESVFVAELEKEFQSRLMTLSTPQHANNNNGNNSDRGNSVEAWLQSLGMADYASLFTSNGFDNLNFLNGVIEDCDLAEMGISSELERQIILDAVKQLPVKIHGGFGNIGKTGGDENHVQVWLGRIHLEQYYDTFNKHLYHDMERVKRIWDVELSAVLDIDKVGHRKRILASVSCGEHIVSGPKLDEINADLNVPKSEDNSITKSPSTHSTNSNNTGTIRHRHKKSRPAPQPPGLKSSEAPAKEQSEKKGLAEMCVGGNNSIKAHWRHQPILLITGCVQYSANYLGSTNVLEFKGTESSKRSIQKVIKNKDRNSEEITLCISYRGVKFVNPNTRNTICEHEIRNINCACQDSESRSYLAYITKEGESFYCHVFQSQSPEIATEIILTLGQAFELAYQMAVREQVTGAKRSGKSAPAVSPGSSSRDFKDSDMKLNGHPLKMKPLTLSIAAEQPDNPTASPKTTQVQRTPTKAGLSEFDA